MYVVMMMIIFVKMCLKVRVQMRCILLQQARLVIIHHVLMKAVVKEHAHIYLWKVVGVWLIFLGVKIVKKYLIVNKAAVNMQIGYPVAFWPLPLSHICD